MLFRESLIRRSGLALAIICLVALVNIALSLAVAHSIQGSAAAINVSGSLRKESYRMLSDWYQTLAVPGALSPEHRRQDIAHFTQRLRHPALLAAIPSDRDHPAARQYAHITALWMQQVRPALEATPRMSAAPQVKATLDHFVAQIENLVTMLEKRTEARIELMNIVQGSSLLFTILIIALMLYDLRNNVVSPLKRLLQVAQAVGRRDFGHRSELAGQDELSRLGQALDQMNDELAISYQGLEARVEEKTHELARSHSALELLHSANRSLYATEDLCEGAVPLLKTLEDLLGIGPIRLYLHDRHASEPVEAMTTGARERPYYCRDHNCNACLVTPHPLDELPWETQDGRRLLLPIRTASTLLGTLEVWYPKDHMLPETSRRLLETLSDQLATAIFLQQQITEQQQLTLAEERAVIARELHDSLAQSLSYLKIQVARLRKVENMESVRELRSEIVDELSTGLNSAYRQLRELLTTFRLKLDTPDLGTALHETTTEFSERLPHPVALAYQMPPNMLSANEEIHILQIVREALSNSVKHAQASEVAVSVRFESPRVRVTITDDGKGLAEGDSPPQHYGLIIMQDRARTLGGRISIRNRKPTGVEVSLTFVPKTRHLIASQASSA